MLKKCGIVFANLMIVFTIKSSFNITNFTGDKISVNALINQNGKMLSRNFDLPNNGSNFVKLEPTATLQSLSVNKQRALQMHPMIGQTNNLNIEILKNEKGYKININGDVKARY